MPIESEKAGQIVFAINGRDKGKAFLVLYADGDYVYLSDGRTRPLGKPKKKKWKHVRPTGDRVDAEWFAGDMQDNRIREVLRSWSNFK